MAEAPSQVLQHVPFPTKLIIKDDASRKKGWEIFKKIWENFEISSQLKEQSKRRRTATLLACFSPWALKVYNSLSFDNKEDKYDIDVVLEKITEFCRGDVNETYERYLFNTRSQGESESIDEFYGALLALAKNCLFGVLTSLLIKDRVIVGMHDNATRRKLLSEKGLTLEKCIEIARSYEATRIRMKAMQDKGDTETVNQVQQVNHKCNQDRRETKRQSTLEGKPKHLSKKCYFCGRNYHNRHSCPAKTVRAIIVERNVIFKPFARPSKAVCEVKNDEPSFSTENTSFCWCSP